MNPYIFNNLGRLNVGLKKKDQEDEEKSPAFASIQVLYRAGSRDIDDQMLTEAGLDRKTFMRGLAAILVPASLGLITLSPFVSSKIDTYLESNPEAAAFISSEEQEVERSWLDFKEDWTEAFTENYPDLSEEEIEGLIFDMYKSSYPEKVERALTSLGFDPDEFLSSDIPEAIGEVPELTEVPVQVNPRGEAGELRIHGKDVSGYYINRETVLSLRSEIDDAMGDMAPWMDESQKEFFSRLFEETGWTESVYPTKDGLFSIEKNVGSGESYGFLQIEPDTALSVLDQVLLAGSEYRDMIEDRVQNTVGMSVGELRSMIADNPRSSLNDNRVVMIVYYLKFANRSFRDIPGFKDGTFDNSMQNRAEIWKNFWNTSGGAGKVQDYFDRNDRASAGINV